ncbi:MAG: prolyl oligopeptidase family protein [Saprospiraceae bacterium]
MQRAKENTPTTDVAPKLTFEPITVDYPSVYRDSSIIDNYHGKRIVDPYRWLEDDRSSETTQWVKAQNQETEQYLAQVPFRNELEKRLSALWNYKRVSAPQKRANRYYTFQNNGLQNQDILYAQDDLGSELIETLNPNQFAVDGTASLGDYAFSKDNDFLAYEISAGGSDWRTINIKDLRTNQVLDENIRWVKFNNISWAGNGFFYSRYPEPTAKDELAGVNEFHQVWYHRIGTNQSEDELVFADRANPQRNFYTSTTTDERFLVLRMTESTSGNALYFRDLQADDDSFIPIAETFEADYLVVDSQGDKLLVLTNQGAPNWRLVQISTRYPAPTYWEEIIPATDDVLQNVQVFNNQIVATYIHNATSKIKVFALTGELIGEIPLPEIGTVQTIRGERTNPQIFIEFTSFTRPTTVYTSNLNSLDINVLNEPNVNFNAGNFVTKQVWFKSYDGEKVPMFITHRKDLKLDGKRPTLLYGYGGFNISILPQFNLTRLNLGPIFLENDGIYAVPNLRGGGEFGTAWHQAGTKEQKQNVFNDFQAAAEYLIGNNYTNSEKLAIYGRSNGGLLVGACMTQRPDLYKVALPAVGVLDMLRYHEFTIGWAWATDYGRSDDPKAFDYLVSYSPLHNVEPQKYPATLVTTADHDDRVVPAHSFKFISELQAQQKGDAPTLIRVATNAGHGAGKSTQQKIDEAADVLGFTFYNLKESVAELE